MGKRPKSKVAARTAKQAKGAPEVLNKLKIDVKTKTWTPENLHRENWDFSPLQNWHEDVLSTAWNWEVDRELGSENGPFLPTRALDQINRALRRFADARNGAITWTKNQQTELLPEGDPRALEHLEQDQVNMTAHLKALEGKAGGFPLPDGECKTLYDVWKPKRPPPATMRHYMLCELLPHIHPSKGALFLGENQFTTVEALEINWTLSETALVNAFRNWLRNGEHALYPEWPHGRNRTHDTQKYAGKKRALLAWLRDLAIFRIAAANISRQDGLKMLGCKVSPANWAHSQGRARKRINARLLSLIACQMNAGNHSPDRPPPRWQDFFERLPTLS